MILHMQVWEDSVHRTAGSSSCNTITSIVWNHKWYCTSMVTMLQHCMFSTLCSTQGVTMVRLASCTATGSAPVVHAPPLCAWAKQAGQLADVTAVCQLGQPNTLSGNCQREFYKERHCLQSSTSSRDPYQGIDLCTLVLYTLGKDASGKLYSFGKTFI